MSDTAEARESLNFIDLVNLSNFGEINPDWERWGEDEDSHVYVTLVAAIHAAREVCKQKPHELAAMAVGPDRAEAEWLVEFLHEQREFAKESLEIITSARGRLQVALAAMAAI